MLTSGFGGPKTSPEPEVSHAASRIVEHRPRPDDVVCLALTGCGGATLAGPAPGSRRRDRRALRGRDGGRLPGAAVMVIRDGEVLHAAGYGFADLERRVPITPRTAFRLASVSKQFTAMAVMILAESGQLAYDDPVVKFLPELSRFGDEITIRHLLTHTGGLPDYYDALDEASTDPMPGTGEAMEFLAGWGSLCSPPARRYEYSNPATRCWRWWSSGRRARRFGRFVGRQRLRTSRDERQRDPRQLGTRDLQPRPRLRPRRRRLHPRRRTQPQPHHRFRRDVLDGGGPRSLGRDPVHRHAGAA